MTNLFRAIFVLLLTVLSLTAQAAVFVVNETGLDAPDTNPGDGFCDAINEQFGGQCTLRAAIMEANALAGFDTIFFDPPAVTIELTIGATGADDASTGDLNITESVAVFGSVFDPAFRPNIVASHAGRIFRIESDDVELTGLVLSGGQSSNHGGALRIDNAENVTIDAVRFFNNSAQTGGGALASFFSDVDITRSDFQINQSPGFGAALFLNAGEVTLAESSVRLSEDTGPEGQREAISVGAAGTLFLSNSTVSTNDGFGIRAANATLSARNSTFTGNSDGDILYLRMLGETLSLRNTALLGGCVMTGPPNGTISINGFNYASVDGCEIGLGGSNIISSEPTLGPPRMSVDDFTLYYIPLEESVLRDNGSPTVDGTGCLFTDQLGIVRPIDGDGDGVARCDIGAIEAAPLPAIDGIFSDRFQLEIGIEIFH